MAQQTEPTRKADKPKVNRYQATEDLFIGRACAVRKGDTFQSTQESVEDRGWAEKVKQV